AVLNKDWDTFYNKELQERRNYLFPPFCHLLTLSCRRASTTASQNAAKKLAAELQQRYPKLKIEGPAPSFREKVQDKYQSQLIVKAQRRSVLLVIIPELPGNWSYDIDPLNLL